MNLKARLSAIDTKPKPRPEAPAAPTHDDCWKKRILRPLDEVPGALNVQRATLALMCAAELPDPFDPRRILYLDTETTGLAGAGTVAFEVGLGFLTDEGFEVRQLLIRDYPEEKYLLREIEKHLERFDLLCTFNGASFDVPLLRGRFLMNRMSDDCLDLPHIDLLHMARRIFKLRLEKCTLSNLEEEVLDIHRSDDLPGAQVPERFFRYLRTGDFSLLADVLRHNEQDIVSMCALLTRLAQWYEAPQSLRHGEDIYSMGVALEKARHGEEARRCYRLVPGGRLHAQGQLRLAASHRRSGERAQSKAIWQGMIARHEGGIAPYVELAKHYEHVERDYAAALEATRQAQLLLAEPSLQQKETVQAAQNALQYRSERLRRKLQETRRTPAQKG